MDEFKYSGGLPPKQYKCSECGNAGVKLWRQYNTLACFVRLLCADCAKADQGVDYEIAEDGMHEGDDLMGPTDTIEWLVPAVPTEDGYTYWGYTSVPQAGCDWWDKRLPLARPKWRPAVAMALMILPIVLVLLAA